MKFQWIAAVYLLLLLQHGAAAQQKTEALKLRGVNYAGAEFGKRPGKLFKDYMYPSAKDLDYFFKKGFNTIRLPFLWERIQRRPNEPLDREELRQIDAVAKITADAGAYLVLDLHNYARYDGAIIGSRSVPVAAFADVWTRLATAFGQNDRVVFGLMNEPHGISAQAWRDAAQAAILAIRRTGARNLILAPGVAWSGAHSWINSGSADALATISDPAGNIAFEAHQYLDVDYSGTHPTCQNATIGNETIQAFASWLEREGRKGFLGEFGASADPVCMRALDGMLREIGARPDLWLGWTYWAAGAWWPDSYPLSVQPDRDGLDRPQMGVLLRHLD